MLKPILYDFLPKSAKAVVVGGDGKVVLPEGYQWCMECEAATPHVKREGGVMVGCVLCGSVKYDLDQCPNCGWERGDEVLASESIEIAHYPTCEHFLLTVPDGVFDYKKGKSTAVRFIRQGPDQEPLMPAGCGCPSFKIYRNLNIFNYWSQSNNSMDSYGGVDWSYNIRCPICGEVFFIEDGSD